MTHKVLFWPDPRLKEVAKPVESYEAEAQYIEEMFETMYANKGIGLASTQLGIPKRIFVMDTTRNGQGTKQAFVNPEILFGVNSITMTEGCLSFPGVGVEMTRLESIIISTLMPDGTTEELELHGLAAVCAQHEMDHLNGIVFFDYLKKTKRMMMEQKLRKNIKRLR
jgi:peptide deformylase